MMNERIQELYNKAWLKVNPSNPQETFTNAFAELIVRECATLAFDGPNGILEHFGLGVEE